jgi:transposase
LHLLGVGPVPDYNSGALIYRLIDSLIAVVACGNPSENLGVQGDVEAGAVAGQPHQQDAGPFQDVGHLETSGVAGPQAQGGGTRKKLQSCGIKVVIPLRRDQIAACKRQGSKGGRPPTLERQTYRERDVVERSFALIKQWRGLATGYDKLAITYRAAVVRSRIVWNRP